MGTLKNQPPRDTHSVLFEPTISTFIEMVKRVSVTHKLTIDQVLRIIEIMELDRKNNLTASDNDIKDEQLAGFGELIEKLNVTVTLNKSEEEY